MVGRAILGERGKGDKSRSELFAEGEEGEEEERGRKFVKAEDGMMLVWRKEEAEEEEEGPVALLMPLVAEEESEDKGIT